MTESEPSPRARSRPGSRQERPSAYPAGVHPHVLVCLRTLRDTHGIALSPHTRRWQAENLLRQMASVLGEDGLASALAAGCFALLDIVVADARALAPSKPPGDVPLLPAVAAAAASPAERVRAALRLLVDGRSDHGFA